MDVISATGLLYFLETNGYFLMFLIMVAEGSIVTYVSAFIASTGIFNIYIVLALSILGNIVGDSILFFLGKHLGKRYLSKHFSKKRGKRIQTLAKHVKKYPASTISIVKVSPLIPIPGIMFIGASGVKFRTFTIYAGIVSVLYSLFFTLLGYFSGEAFSLIAKNIGKTELIIGVAILLGTGIWLIISLILKKIQKRVEKYEITEADNKINNGLNTKANNNK